MRVSIFGLGYVGTVSAGCLANDGHEVLGVDPIQTKVDLINDGRTPIIEAEIGEIIAANVKSGQLRAVVDAEERYRQRICRLVRRYAQSAKWQSRLAIYQADLRANRRGH